MPSIVEILDQHIAEAEKKAQTSYKRQKWMMFGYWKAIAVHLRKIQREVIIESGHMPRAKGRS